MRFLTSLMHGSRPCSQPLQQHAARAGRPCASRSGHARERPVRCDARRPTAKPGEGASKDLIAAMSELSKGRTGKTGSRAVFGPDQLSWKAVDEAVNQYPCKRSFTAIGDDTPGDESFRDAMVSILERALECKLSEDAIVLRSSRGGKYLSVRLGPVTVSSAEDVVTVYQGMKKDGRMRWFL